MAYGLIYLVANKINGKVYVGQTTKPLGGRWSRHKSSSSHCNRLSAAIKKYGSDSFTVDAIYTADSKEELDRLEKRCIVLMDSVNSGYNVCPGGSNGVEFTEDRRNKIKMAALGRSFSSETRQKLSVSLKGRIVSAETRDKLRAASTGRTHSAETKAKMSSVKKGKVTPDAVREKLRIVSTGRTHTPEMIARLSAIRAAWWAAKRLAA